MTNISNTAKICNCYKIVTLTFFFSWLTFISNAQVAQNYIAKIIDVNQGQTLTNVNSITHLNIGQLENDTIILLPDTAYANRKINFSLSSNYCEDLSVVLHDIGTSTLFGYRIIENKVTIIFDDLIIEGPFDGTDIHGASTTVSNDQIGILNYRVEYDEPEVNFYLNDILVLRSCVGVYGLNFEHNLLPTSGTEATVSLSFESY